MSAALTGDRLARILDNVRDKCDALEPNELAKLDAGMALEDIMEHFQYQQLQAESHATGKLTPEAAQVIYIALGENFSSTNGGWSVGTDTATKVVVTQLMAELLTMKIKSHA